MDEEILLNLVKVRLIVGLGLFPCTLFIPAPMGCFKLSRALVSRAYSMR